MTRRGGWFSKSTGFWFSHSILLEMVCGIVMVIICNDIPISLAMFIVIEFTFSIRYIALNVQQSALFITI